MTLHRFDVMQSLSLHADIHAASRRTDPTQPLFHLFLCHVLTFIDENLVAPHPDLISGEEREWGNLSV
jgi:hypothetical protein